MAGMKNREIWKDIPGFADIYQISDCGNVRNKRTGKQKTPWENSKGYMSIILYRKGHRFAFLIHRLMLAVFEKDCLHLDPGVQGHHKDVNRYNNHLTNLELLGDDVHSQLHSRLNESF